MELSTHDNHFLDNEVISNHLYFWRNSKLRLQPFIPELVSLVTKNLCPFNNAHHQVTVLNKQNRNGQDVSVWIIYEVWKVWNCLLILRIFPSKICTKWPPQICTFIRYTHAYTTHTHKLMAVSIKYTIICCWH